MPLEQPPVSLIYIMGTLRSGSTLLSTIIGGLPGVLNAGELRSLWKQMDGSPWLCGCGEPMVECEFWQQVVGASGVSVPEAAALCRRYQRSRLRIRNLGQLAREGASDPLDDDYRAIMQGLFRGLREVSGKPIILDNSKSATDVVFYQRFTDEAIRAIHVVRDPRAVAYSMAKQKAHQMRDGETKPMSHMGARRSSSFWLQTNIAADRAAKSLSTSVRLRYEDSCLRPAEELSRLSDFLGIPMPADLIGADGTFERPKEHTVSGNPDRWTTGRERIKVDDKWRHSLPRRSAAAVTSLTWPWMLKYGYPLLPG